MTTTSRYPLLFEGQAAHALLLALLTAVTLGIAYGAGEVFAGSWLGISTAAWFYAGLGADQFIEDHRHRGLCRRGIFRYVPNSMYIVGFLCLWAPAIASASRAGLLLAAFNQIYTWVHYFCTERPDMRRIYS